MTTGDRGAAPARCPVWGEYGSPPYRGTRQGRSPGALPGLGGVFVHTYKQLAETAWIKGCGPFWPLKTRWQKKSLTVHR